MEFYLACKNNDIMNFAGTLICLDNIILSEVSQSQKEMHVCTHLQMNNNNNVQVIHAAFLGPEETKQEGRLRGLIDGSAAESTDCSWERLDFKSQQAYGG